MQERSVQGEGVLYSFQGDLLTGDFDPRAISDSVVFQNDELLTIHAAARRAGVSRASILSWIRNGFITAQTSPEGWLIRAGDIEKARDGADEARLGRAVDVEVLESSTTLVADAEQTSERTRLLVPRSGHVLQPQDQSADAFLAPLAEFVRDQADIVQEQAETIGWLQAELRRARQQLESAEEETTQTDEATENETEDEADPAGWDFDPFTDPLPTQDDADMLQSAIMDSDPFSDEPDEVRLMIEDTERKIINLWDEQHQLTSRHVRSHEESEASSGSWVRRLMSSWRKNDAAD